MRKVILVILSICISFIFITSSTILSADSKTRIFKWENTVIDIPVYSDLALYSDLTTSTLYVDSIKSDMKVVAMPDTIELARVNTSRLGHYEVHYGAVCNDASISVRCGRIHIVTFNVIDTKYPVVCLSNRTVDLPFGSDLTAEDVKKLLIYADNYDSNTDLLVSIDLSNFNKDICGTYKVYINVTDTSGNTKGEILTVNVCKEKIPPNVNLLVDKLEIYINSKPETKLDKYISVFDNQTLVNDLDITYSDNINYSVLGNYYIRYVVYDESGNSTKITLPVEIIRDDIPPEVIYNDSIYSIPYASNYKDISFKTFLTISDNCSVLDEINVSPEKEIDTYEIGIKKVKLIIADSSMNITEILVNIEVTADTTPPVIFIRGDLRITETNRSTYNYKDYYSVSDNATKESDLVIEYIGSPNFDLEGTYIVTIYVTDDFNNKSSEQLTVIVLEDAYYPSLILSKETLEIGITDELSDQYLLSFVDVVGYNKKLNKPDIELDRTKFIEHKEGEYVVFFSVELENEVIWKSLKIIVLPDTESPIIKPILKEPYEVRYNSNLDQLITKDSFFYKDNFDDKDDLITNLEIENINLNLLGLQSLVFSVSDLSGNITFYKLEIIVFDDVSPSLKLLDNINSIKLLPNSIHSNNEYFYGYDEFDGDITARISGFNDGNFTAPGNYYLNLELIDQSGNETVKSVYINVVDDVAPVLVLTVDNINYLYDKEFNDELFLNYILEASDNYDSLTKNDVEIDFSNVKNLSGNYVVNYSLTDSSLNETTRTLNLYLYSLNPPKLVITNPTIEVGAFFNYQNYIRVFDDSDLDIYDSLVVSNLNNLDVSQVGIYNLGVSVTNNSNVTTTGQMIVEVVNNSDESDTVLNSVSDSYTPDNEAENNFFSANIEIFIIIAIAVFYFISKNVYRFVKNKPKDDEV